MRIAFHAPLKPPDHPVPSGDREMARALLALMREAGHAPWLASRLRTFDRDGDLRRQRRIARLGHRLADRILRRIDARILPRPDLWLTYHNYHKAPDHLGPRVSRALAIPYVVVEASIAPKRASGAWAEGHAAALVAARSADAILAVTERDRACLLAAVAEPDRVRRFPPFIDTVPFAAEERAAARARWAKTLSLPPSVPWILSVAMMRDDVKRRSYALLATALGRCLDLPWMLVAVGDGPARGPIEAMLATLGPRRIRLPGALPRAVLPSLYTACDLFAWPGLEEAFGMVYLEAGAAGLPVVATADGGVPEIVRDGVTGRLAPPHDGDALAAALRRLLTAPAERLAMGTAARRHVSSDHGRAAAAAALADGLAFATARRRR